MNSKKKHFRSEQNYSSFESIKSKKATNPTVSIISINKCNGGGLRKTLTSIDAQLSKDFEVIVVDGHSNDDTLDVVDEFASLITRFCVEERPGVYAAMNQGVGLANGTWTIFLNSGDSFFSHRVLSDFKPNSISQLAYGYAYLEESIRPAPYNGLENIWKGQPFCHQALFTRTEILKAHPFDENLKIAADYKFLVRAFSDGFTFEDLQQDICRIEPPGISGKRIFLRLYEKYIIAKQAFPDKPLFRLTVKQCFDHYRHKLRNKLSG